MISFSSPWIVVLEDVFMDPPSFPGYLKADLIKVDLERLGRPIVGSLHAWVFRREDISVAEVPPLPYVSGPGVEPDSGWASLWPTDIFEGLGSPLWRDDPGVMHAVFLGSNGLGPLWASPGFAFSLPAQPMRLRSVSGDLVEGLLCSSLSEPGAWLMLSSDDISALLGVSPVPYHSLKKEIGSVATASLFDWISEFPFSA